MLYPCLCLCFWFAQMIRTTPWRRTTLHFTQIFLTDDLTFTSLPYSFVRYRLPTMRPRVTS